MRIPSSSWHAMALALSLALAVGCVKPVSDPNAVAPNYDRWQTTVAGSPAQTFDVAMRVLADSSYRVADARKDAGIIKTEYRKSADFERGAKAMRLRLLAGDFQVRLTLVMTPAAGDSTRVDLSGEWKHSEVDRVQTMSARESGWEYVSNIGQAIVAGAKQ